MKHTTLVFLVRRVDGKITEICLAMKKRGFGMGRWNGVGGKVEGEESIEDATRREAQEEIDVGIGGLIPCAELTFQFALKPEWNQLVHTFIADAWTGTPIESEEMSPRWFAVADIPYSSMWPDDIFWLPFVLENKHVIATFVFGENDIILSQEVVVTEQRLT